ncbi:hypothetical protein I541_5735 [Mycobacteroides abscessus]|nr:hypothetical protein I541_5735 [Mycobacteroides abscessus]
MGNSPQLLYLEMRHIELLWYVGAYLLTLAFMPCLARIRTAHQLGWFIAAMCPAHRLTDTVSLITDTWADDGLDQHDLHVADPPRPRIGYQRRLVPGRWR